MPQVPYHPVPTATPTEQGPRGFSVSTPGAAFGENIGRALEQFGGVEGKVGDELFARANALQQLRNEAERAEGDAKYMAVAGKLHAEYNALEGKNRVDAFPKYQQDLDAARKDIRASLSNDMVRKMYDSSSLSVMGRSIFNGAGASADANKEYLKGTSKALIEESKRRVFDAPSEVERDAALETVRQESAKQSDLLGMGEDFKRNLTEKNISEVTASYISGIARVRPFEAGEELEKAKAKGQIDQQDYDKVLATVNSKQNISGSRNIADKIMEPIWQGDPNKPEKTLDELLKEGDAAADAQSKGNPELKNHVRNEVERQYFRHERSVEDAVRRNENILKGALLPMDEQKVPKSLDDVFKNDPRASAAWDALPREKKREFNNILTKLSHPDFSPAGRTEYANSPEGIARWQELLGMAHNDPVGFSKMNLTGERLPISMLHSFMTKQQQVVDGKLHVNQTVNEALAYLKNYAGTEMEALGVHSRAKGDKVAYDKLTGLLTAKTEAYITDKGKKPDDAVFRAWWSQFTTQIPERRGTYDLRTHFIEMFKSDIVNVPDEKFIKDFKEQVKAAGKPEPSDETIARYYLRQQMNKSPEELGKK